MAAKHIFLYAIYLTLFLVASVTESDAKNSVMHAIPSFIKLAADEALVHPIVKGSLGPWPETYVVLTRQNALSGDFAPFKARVVIPHGASVPPAVYQLPQRRQSSGGPIFDVLGYAVLFRRIDNAGQKALLILYNGVGGVDGRTYFYMCYVYRWDGTKFIGFPELSEYLFGARNAKEVDRRLILWQSENK